MNKIDWFQSSKKDDEWVEYFISRMPFSTEDIIDLEDYVVFRIAAEAIEDGLGER